MNKNVIKETDILIVGCGCAGLCCALQLDKTKRITVITKSDCESSDSFLAQGGMCMLRDSSDYDSYFEDTMRAGHYENDRTSVDIMIRSSREVAQELVELGVEFQREQDGSFAFTREGAHSSKRILFHEDITGQEITSKLLAEAKKRENIILLEHVELCDILCEHHVCYGGVVRGWDGSIYPIRAHYTVLATGGIGGLYRHSTNFRHLTGDGVAIAARHGVKLQDVDYIQIHPTTLYSEKAEDRSFLISESVRGEGARLYNKNMERFVDELLPRDRLTQAIREQMAKDGTDYVWEDLSFIPEEELMQHFPNIVQHCREMGYDVTRECIPVVPAQHYFMGGIQVDHQGATSMDRLYAVGETACNGVHGRNRLASNSLLESMVFAERAAREITERFREVEPGIYETKVDEEFYSDRSKLAEEYKTCVEKEIERARRNRAERK